MLKNIKILLTRNQKKQCIFLFFGSVVASFIEIIGIGSIPVFAMVIIDINLLKSKLPSFVDPSLFDQFNQNQIALFSAITLIVIFLLKNLYLTLMIYWLGKVTISIRSIIKSRLMKSYINAPYVFHLQRNPAELLRSVTGDASNATDVILSTIVLFRELLLLILIFALLFYVDPFISFSVFLFLIFFVGLFFFLTKKKLKIIGKMIQYFSGIEIKIVNQGLGAIKEVKILNKEKHVEEIFKQNFGEIEKNAFLSFFINSMPRLFLEVVSVMAVVVISTIFVFMDRSTISIIPLISLLAISAVRLVPAFGAISTSLVSIRTKTPSFDFVSKEISELENTTIPLDQGKKEEIKFFKNIYVKEINFRYPNTKIYSIIILNLLINSGKKIGFIGNSGAGKSTFVNLLLGLLQPTEGKILVDGKDISENLRNWQSQIGYVPQEIYLLDDTIRNNIAFGHSATNINSDHVSNAIKLAQLESFINSLPDGEETIVGNVGIRLSGGQKQRIGIARALYINPRILVFDEATSSLDIENEQKIISEIFSLGRSTTLVIITHRHQTVQNCDIVFLLDKGKLIDQGKYDYLNHKYNLNSFIKKKSIRNEDI